MPEVFVSIEVWCATCNAGLCGTSTGTERRGKPCIEVEACEKCLERERDKFYEDGHRKGYEEGCEDTKQKYE